MSGVLVLIEQIPEPEVFLIQILNELNVLDLSEPKLVIDVLNILGKVVPDYTGRCSARFLDDFTFSFSY